MKPARWKELAITERTISLHGFLFNYHTRVLSLQRPLFAATYYCYHGNMTFEIETIWSLELTVRFPFLAQDYGMFLVRDN